MTGLLLVGAVGLAGLMLRDRVPPLDRWIADDLYAPPESNLATVATAVSGIGTIACLCLLIAVVGTAIRRSRSGWRYLALLACCLGVIATQAIFQRSGPTVTAQDWTYPSGHAVFVTSIAITVILAARALRPTWRIGVFATGTVAVLLVSASRLVLGEHYLVDVVAAIAATLGVGLLTSNALRLPLATSSAPSR